MPARIAMISKVNIACVLTIPIEPTSNMNITIAIYNINRRICCTLQRSIVSSYMYSMIRSLIQMESVSSDSAGVGGAGREAYALEG